MALGVRGAGDVMAWWMDRWMDSGRRRRWCWWCVVEMEWMDGWVAHRYTGLAAAAAGGGEEGVRERKRDARPDLQ